MKKITSLIVAAAIGGTASTGLYKLLEEKSPNPVSAMETISKKNSQNATGYLTGLSGLPEKTIDFISAAEMTVNAVVHVKTEMQPPSNYYYFDPFRDFFFGNPQQNPQPVISAGSGVIVSSDGYIVTNNHVVKGAEKVQVTLNDKKSYAAEIIATDPNTDLALLKIEGQNFPYIPYGNSDNLKVGEWVLAVGNPFNLNSTVTAGIVSAKGRSINILEGDLANGIAPVESFIQTDAAVNPGNSGGALVNTAGELIGINTAIKSNTGSYTGYSFAVPVNIVKKVIDDLLEYGVVQRAFIGVSIRDIDSELADQKGIKDLKGVYVSGISEDGAAMAAGIKEGDIITKIGNVRVTDVPGLQEQVSKFRPGNDIIVTISRDGVEKEFTVNLKNRFGNTEVIKKDETQVLSDLSASFQEVSKDEMSKLKIVNGLKIVKMNGGKLRSAGIKEGFIITKVDKKDINTYDDLVTVLKNKKGGVLIEGVYPNGMRAYYGFGM